MDWPTIIVASVIAVTVIAIIVREVKNRKAGKGCSCGGNCAACGACHCGEEKK